MSYRVNYFPAYIHQLDSLDGTVKSGSIQKMGRSNTTTATQGTCLVYSRASDLLMS